MNSIARAMLCQAVTHVGVMASESVLKGLETAPAKHYTTPDHKIEEYEKERQTDFGISVLEHHRD